MADLRESVEIVAEEQGSSSAQVVIDHYLGRSSPDEPAVILCETGLQKRSHSVDAEVSARPS